jgi:hypothetical protein
VGNLERPYHSDGKAPCPSSDHKRLACRFVNTSPSGKKSDVLLFKAHLHYGKNRAKLVGFKEQKTIFCMFKTR